VREMLDVGRFSKEIFVQRFTGGLPREVFAWSNLACEVIALYA